MRRGSSRCMPCRLSWPPASRRGKMLDTFLPRSNSIGGGGSRVPGALPHVPLATQPPIAVTGGAAAPAHAEAGELDTLLPLSRATASQLQAWPAPVPAASGPLAAPAGVLSEHALTPSYITSAGQGSRLADPLALPGAAPSGDSSVGTPQTASRSARWVGTLDAGPTAARASAAPSPPHPHLALLHPPCAACALPPAVTP